MTLLRQRVVSTQVNEQLFEQLHMSFRVALKRTGKDKAKATIKIFNASEEAVQASLDASKTDRDFVRLYAGHEQLRGLLFEGDVIPRGARFERPSGSGNTVLTLQARTGYRRNRTSELNLTLDRDATGDEIIAACADALGVSIDTRDFPDDVVFNGGFSYKGNAAELLNQVTRRAGFDVIVQGSTILLVPQGGTDFNLPREFSTEAGTLLMPPRIKDKRVFTCRVMLTPELVPGYRFTIRHPRNGGVYKADEVTHVGDSGFAPSYYTDVQMRRSE